MKAQTNLIGCIKKILKQTIRTYTVIILIVLIKPDGVYADTSYLDPTFGSGGKVANDFLGNTAQGNAAASQPDGKIVVAGFTFNESTSGDFAIARYNRDGNLDTHFGNGGRVTTDFFLDFDQAEALALQPDGKIVLAGTTFDPNSGTGGDIALVRYNKNGTLDMSFGSNGKVITDFFSDQDNAKAVTVLADGKILVAGRAGDPNLRGGFALVRYNRNGSLDTSFGNAGKVTTNFMTADVLASLDQAHAIFLQPNGKIVVVGERNGISQDSSGEIVFDLDFALARYNQDGTLDMDFGNSGKIITNFGKDDVAYAVALQTGGKIVVVGDTGQQSVKRDFALARYAQDGSLDTHFGTKGKVTTDFFGGEDTAKGVAILPNGSMVLAGYATKVNTGSDFALARYSRDGRLETHFGKAGEATTDFFGGDDQASAIVRQPDGKVVAAGFAFNTYGSNFNFALARYSFNSTKH